MATTKHTIPTGFGSKFSDHDYLVNIDLAIRECEANAIVYGARIAYCVMVYKPKTQKEDGQNFLLFMHDGKPFDDIHDILSNGCTPNTTGGKGFSFQGAGLSFSSSCLALKHKLVIASFVKDKLLVGMAHADRRNARDWIVEEATEEYASWLYEIIGKNEISKYNVFYLMAIEERAFLTGKDRGTKLETRTFLATRDIIDLIFISGEMNRKIDLRIGERQIGYDGYGERAKNQFRFKSIEASLTAEGADGLPSGRGSQGFGGATRSPIFQPSIYFDKYAYKKYSMRWENLTVKTKSKPETYVTFPSGTVDLCLFKGQMDERESWLMAVREGKTEHDVRGPSTYGISATYPGRKPNHLVYLTMPCISNGAMPMERFRTNPLWFTSSMAEFMSALGLQYKDVGPAFAMLYISIDSMEPLLKTISDGEQLSEDYSAIELADDVLQLRPDFTLRQSVQCRSLVKQACIAAASSVTEECKTDCKNLFPLDVEDYVELEVSKADSRASRRLVRYQTFDVATGGLFDKKFYTDSSRAVAIYDIRRRQFVSASDVSPGNGVKGVKIIRISGPSAAGSIAKPSELRTGLEKLQKYANDVRIVGVVIDQPTRNNMPIKISEYHRGDSPTRHVGVVINGKPYDLGVVVDLPVQSANRKEKADNNNPKTGKKTKGDGKGDDNGGSKPYDPRHSEAICRFDSEKQILNLNPNHPFIKEYFVGTAVTPVSKRLLQKLYSEWESRAKSLCRAAIAIEQIETANVQKNEEGVEVFDDNAWDYLINMQIKDSINSSVLVRDLIRQIDLELGKAIPESEDAIIVEN